MKHNWIILGSKARGSFHKKNMMPCEDSFHIHYGGKIGIGVLSDGAGFSKFAKSTAQIVTKNVLKKIKENINAYLDSDDTFIKNDMIDDLHDLLEQEAQRLYTTFSEMAATLLFVAVKDNEFIAGHIGDGTIGVLYKSGLTGLSMPENGKFINETFFVNDMNVQEHFRIYRGYLDVIEGFILISDGAYENMFNHKTMEFGRAGIQMMDWCSSYSIQAVQIALDETIEKMALKTHDDCSIVIMRKRKR